VSRARALRRRFLRALERADAVVDPSTALPITAAEADALRRVFLDARVRRDGAAVFVCEVDETRLATLEQVVRRLEAIARRRH
jgi:hypothetical protein